eukprot:TRINITY_DN8445_c0_g2_i2.p1 TRINITY_DN8445_c0_g2~~TRINITY_DN8445_c0_g2_i2.p1  ORF type:complete len:144 (-),score=37.07 TRINITY_DN8445_c0_g2_i2:514-945(-)
MLRSLVGSEMCIRDSINAEYGIVLAENEREMKFKCTVNKCPKQDLLESPCKLCRQHFCRAHLIERDHDCAVLKERQAKGQAALPPQGSCGSRQGGRGSARSPKSKQPVSADVPPAKAGSSSTEGHDQDEKQKDKGCGCKCAIM